MFCFYLYFCYEKKKISAVFVNKVRRRKQSAERVIPRKTSSIYLSLIRQKSTGALRRETRVVSSDRSPEHGFLCGFEIPINQITPACSAFRSAFAGCPGVQKPLPDLTAGTRPRDLKFRTRRKLATAVAAVGDIWRRSGRPHPYF